MIPLVLGEKSWILGVRLEDDHIRSIYGIIVMERITSLSMMEIEAFHHFFCRKGMDTVSRPCISPPLGLKNLL